jgi:hypothetical protein
VLQHKHLTKTKNEQTAERAWGVQFLPQVPLHAQQTKSPLCAKNKPENVGSSYCIICTEHKPTKNNYTLIKVCEKVFQYGETFEQNNTKTSTHHNNHLIVLKGSEDWAKSGHRCKQISCSSQKQKHVQSRMSQQSALTRK